MRMILTHTFTQGLLITLGLCTQGWATDRAGDEWNAQAIYGNDDRREYYEEASRYWRAKADSTVALMTREQLRVEGPMTHIQNESFADWIHLCPGEAYEKQWAAANCSGALVAEDLVLTAGHCMEGKKTCAETAFAFGYRLPGPRAHRVDWLPTDEIYFCQEVVSEGLKDGIDFAVVRLDRPVAGHRPLPMRRNGRPSLRTPLIIIGHPSGLPTKIADGGHVRSLEEDFFTASLDSFQGNSGSAVFNANTGDIEGILVRGEEDWKRDERAGCNRPRRCSEHGCQGEDISYVQQALDAIP